MNTHVPLKLSILGLFIIWTVKVDAQQFIEKTGTGLPNVGRGYSAVGDYNNDGYPDIIMTGEVDTSATPVTVRYISKIFKNNGDGTFTENQNAVLPGVAQGTVAWGDYDNDGYLDILITGLTGKGSAISKIYRNSGPPNFTFTENTKVSIPGINSGSAAWGDYNNDGHLDFFVTGKTDGAFGGGSSGSPRTSKIYKNNGDGTFTDLNIPAATFVTMSTASVIWADYDNDGDLDIVEEGYPTTGNYIKNNGDGTFTGLGRNTALPNNFVQGTYMDMVDYSNSGVLNPVVSGGTKAGMGILPVNATFQCSSSTGVALTIVGTAIPTLAGTSLPTSVAWGDYNNDGIQDVIITGQNNAAAPANLNFTKFYKQSPVGTFTEQTDFTMPTLRWANVLWADFDRDGKLDFLITGNDNIVNTNIGQTHLYLNKSTLTKASNAPVVPSGLATTAVSNYVNLTWNKPTDDEGGIVETPQLGLTYEVRLGTSPGGTDVKYPTGTIPAVVTDPSYPIIPSLGKIRATVSGATVSYPVRLIGGKYYWSVQSIDYTFRRSSWAAEQSFVFPSQVPATQASNITISNLSPTQADISWTKGSGYKRVVFIYEGQTGAPTIADAQTYAADTVYSHGSEAGAGWYCIYNGNGNKVTVTGLNQKKSYLVVVYEYDGFKGYEKFNTSSVTGNPLIFATKVSQLIAFDLPSKTFLDPPFKISYTITTGDGTVGSGNPVVFTSQTPSVAAIFGTSGDSIKINGAGTAIIEANMAGNADYASAYMRDTIIVVKAKQIISFQDIPTKTYFDLDFVLNATASSSLPVSFASMNTDFATVNGNTATIVMPGTVNIVASQSGDNNYLAATSVSKSLTINKASQTITFDPLPGYIKNTDTITLGATSSSGLRVSYSSSDLSIALVQGDLTTDKLTFYGGGTAAITAYQSGNDFFLAATPVLQTINVTSVTGVQTIDDRGLRIYPNPATNKVTVELGNWSAKTSVTIYSHTGQAIYTSMMDEAAKDIDLSGYAPGVYIIKIVNSGKVAVKQLVKQ